MKSVISILLMVFALQAMAQDTLLDKKITLSLRQASLEEALHVLEKSCECSFSYGADLLPLQQKVSITAQNSPLRNILQDILGTAYSFKQVGKQIVIYRIERREASRKFIINGYVKDAHSGEMLMGASVYIPQLSAGMATNNYGFYALALPAGTYRLQCSYLGYTTYLQTLTIEDDLRMDISLEKEIRELQEITVIVPGENQTLENLPISTHALSATTISSTPTLAGEADVIKTIQLLPGVKTLGEGSSGFFVRGGGMDQNLILLDEAPVYNPSHLLGFFSTFNADAIKDVKLYKGAIPAQFGGRLSSLLDVRMRDGNTHVWKASGGIGLISSRLTVEGPIKKDKSSAIISLRRSYADLFLPILNNPDIADTRLYFYDINAKLNYTFNARNRLYLSGYLGRDLFHEKGEFNIGWGNQTATLRWNHLFNEKLFSNFTLLYSKFNYQLGVENDDQSESLWTSYIRDISLKTDLTLYAHAKHTLRFGINSILHSFNPGILQNESNSGEKLPVGIPKRYALEHAAYLSHTWKINTLLVEYGLRYSLLQNVGPGTEYQYNNSHQLTDSVTHASGSVYHHSGGLEPRFHLQWRICEQGTLQASYTRMRQYVHLISNYAASFSAPDIWLPSGPGIKPQLADQIAVGYSHNLPYRGKKLELSLEGYYKQMNNQLDYKDHASLALNPYIESELRVGKGWSYGIEALLSKKWGKLTGYISYTWSRTLRKTPEVKEGKAYPARYDKPHAISIVGHYAVSGRWTVSANWVFSTGEAVTLPKGSFEYRGKEVPIYSDRNAERLPDYHRLDVSATWKPAKKTNRRFEGSWTFALYNAYYRKNTFALNYNRYVDTFGNIVSVPFSSLEPLFETRKAVTKTYLFAIVPSLTYNFKF